MSDNKEDCKEMADPELDDLLNSTLQDMTKLPSSTQQLEAEEREKANAFMDNAKNMWSEEFMTEAAAQFESNMAMILGNINVLPEDDISQEEIAATYAKMAEAAALLMKPPSDATEGEQRAYIDDPEIRAKIDQVTAAIKETLRNLQSNTEDLQNVVQDQDIASMFSNISLGEPGQEGNMFVPFMQEMMQSLLSKEVLYPSLKELEDKYPIWLADNKGKLEQSEYDRYTKQQELMKKVCDALESEQATDPEDVKKKRFEQVLALMQKMQELGQPPTDLVGNMSGPPPAGLVDQSQCTIM